LTLVLAFSKIVFGTVLKFTKGGDGHMSCGTMVPGHTTRMFGSDCRGIECILPSNHNGPHIIRTPDSKYFAWETDYDCDCCEPEASSYDRCCVYWELASEDVQKALAG